MSNIPPDTNPCSDSPESPPAATQTISLATPSNPGILDRYIQEAPNLQNALDIFRDEWSSDLPSPFDHLKAGSIGLFNDDRVDWFLTQLGGIKGKTVLELGPLEAGHTFMLEKNGAAQITAIESNTRAFLKCLVIKEILGLTHSQFLCGDFVEYLRQNQTKFDICFASGVLYHMRDPVETIALIAKHCTYYLFLWTHYYDETIIRNNPALAPRFNHSQTHEYAGFTHTRYQQEYQHAVDWAGFCGGSAPISYWLPRQLSLEWRDYFGFDVIEFGFDQPDHPNGPAFALIAKAKSAKAYQFNQFQFWRKVRQVIKIDT